MLFRIALVIFVILLLVCAFGLIATTTDLTPGVDAVSNACKIAHDGFDAGTKGLVDVIQACYLK